MKKTILALSVIQTLLLVGCGGQQGMPGQVMPGYANGGYATGTGNGYASTPGYSNDPYATGGGYASTPGYSNDPYATGGGYASTPGYSNDPYATGGGYASTPGYSNDPYATGNNGYANTPNYGANTGYTNGVNGAYGTGTNTGYGNTQIDPMTGQPIMVSNVSQDIISKIQAAGGSGALKSDDVVRDSLKSISISQALGQSPLDHRVLIIKTLLDGYAGTEDRNYAKQIWGTILPQDQQRLMSQDSELSKLITDKLLKDSSGGIGSILGSAKKLIGLG
jgi:hypothetical protein